MTATVRQIVDDALEIVGEVAGAGVQTYEEDIMRKAAVRAFNVLFKKYEWRHYLKWYQFTLDGTLGIITTDSLESVLDFEDILGVWRDGEIRPLPVFPRNFNPYAMGTNNSKVLYWDSLHVTDANYTKRKIQFYPVQSVGLINVHARVYPLATLATNWDWSDIMHLDRDLLALSTAYWTLVGDDLNANAAEKVQAWAQARFVDIVAGLSRHPIPISGQTSVPTEWFTYPGV